MATLNTLRTKGGVFLIVVIAVALVAFLLGDLSSLGGGYNSKKMRVGTINGTNINYIEFLTETENTTNVLQTLYGQSALQQEQLEQVRQSVWESMIIKNAYVPGFKKLGLTVGEAEMVDMSKGQYISPIARNVFANPQTGAYDPAVLQNFVSSIEYNAAYQPVWSYLTDQMESERLMSKYVALVQAGVNVNSLEVASAMRMNGAQYNAEYAFKSYTSIADSLVSVSKSEIKKYYDENKESFKQKASRDIEYVVFNLLPSAEDYKEASERIDEIAAEFAAAEDAAQYAALNSQGNTNFAYVTVDALPYNFQSLVGKNKQPMYGPVLENDVYTIARVADTKMEPDTLAAKHILIAAGKQATADSIVKALKGGASFEALASQYSLDPTVDLGRFAPEQMVSEFADACVAAKVGEIFTVDSQFGTHIVNLTYKTKPVEKVKVATVIYNVEPSATTQQAVYTEARTFVEKAGQGYDNFSNAVAEMALARRMATIASTDRGVNGLNDASAVSRWVFNGEVGDVSPILDVDGGDYLVAVIKEVREEGYAPVEKVSSRIETRVRNEKKAEMIEAEFAGKETLGALAAVEGVKEGTAEDVTFGSFYVPGVGMEPKFIGAVCVSAPNLLSKPIAATGGVYVFNVKDKNAVEINEADEQVRLESIAESYITERLSQALDEESVVVDNRVKFF